MSYNGNPIRICARRGRDARDNAARRGAEACMEVKNRRVAEVFEICSMKTRPLLAILWKEEECCRRGHARKGNSDLSTLFLNPVQDCAKCRLGEATVEPGLLIVLVPQTHSLRAIIECITKRFMDAFDGVALSHKNLGLVKL